MILKLRNLAARFWPVDYDTYIVSERWRRKATACKKRAGRRCQMCNYADKLHAHHRTYERLGYEAPGDLTCLCAKCHRAHHQRIKHGR